jgi:aspartate/methionine/tyrosine aminotransferase
MLVPAQLAAALRKIQDTILISPPIISQLAALGALQANTGYLQTHLNEIKNSRTLCLQALNNSEVLQQTVQSEGAFYIFARIQSRLSDLETAHYLIREHGVATIPGSAFAAEGYLRISYGALTSDSVDTGMQRLIKGLQQLT